MKALQVERSPPLRHGPRGRRRGRLGQRVGIGPLRLVDIDPPDPPGRGWQRLSPRCSRASAAATWPRSTRRAPLVRAHRQLPVRPRPRGRRRRHRRPGRRRSSSSRCSAARPEASSRPARHAPPGRTGLRPHHLRRHHARPADRLLRATPGAAGPTRSWPTRPAPLRARRPARRGGRARRAGRLRRPRRPQPARWRRASAVVVHRRRDPRAVHHRRPAARGRHPLIAIAKHPHQRDLAGRVRSHVGRRADRTAPGRPPATARWILDNWPRASGGAAVVYRLRRHRPARSPTPWPSPPRPARWCWPACPGPPGSTSPRCGSGRCAHRLLHLRPRAGPGGRHSFALAFELARRLAWSGSCRPPTPWNVPPRLSTRRRRRSAG